MKFISFFTLCSVLVSASIFAEQDRFPDVAEKAIPAVVTIKVEMGSKNDDNGSSDPFGEDLLRRFFGYGFSPFSMRQEHPPGSGSGFFVSNNGVILTNNHVVSGYKIITVITNDGEEYEGRLLGADPQTDLAVVKIDAENTPYLPLGDSNKLRIAESVIAAGSPLGLKSTITKGIVSATGRSNLDIVPLEDFIQTDAAINRGNSGGPLLNANGEVIGINTAIATTGSGSIGLNLAVPSNIAKEVLDQILANGSVSRGFLGVEMQVMTEELAHAFGLEKNHGAILADVSPGSAAEKAGLQRGDVILSMNGKPIESKSSLKTHVAMLAPGSKVNLGIKRGNDLITIPVVLGARPEVEKVSLVETPILSRLGLVVETLTPDAAKSLGHGDEEGVVVTKIDPKGAVGRIGIKKGALILSVNQKKISSPAEFQEVLEESSEKDGILLQVKQDGYVRYVYLRGV